MNQLKSAVQLIKDGQKSKAREILLKILIDHRDNEQAWLYLASCARDEDELKQCIQEVLSINPENEMALKIADKHDIPMPKPRSSPPTLPNLRAVDSERISETLQQKSSSNSRVFVYGLLFIIAISIFAVGVALTVINSDEDGSSSSNNAEATEIYATNEALEQSINEEATLIAETLAASE